MPAPEFDFETESSVALLHAGAYGADTALNSVANVFESEALRDKTYTGAEIAGVLREAQNTWREKIDERAAELEAEA